MRLQIEGYNSPWEDRYGVRNLFEITAKRLTVVGFICGDDGYGPAYREEHQKKVQEWIADGSFAAKFHITEGIENSAEAFLELFRGKNFGRAVVKIKD